MRRLVCFLPLLLFVCACARPLNPELDVYRPQIASVQALSNAALTYKITTEFLARACVTGTLSEKDCEEIKELVGQVRASLLDAARITEQILNLATDPYHDAICGATLLACGNDLRCQEEALRACNKEYLTQYEMALEHANILLRRLERYMVKAQQKEAK